MMFFSIKKLPAILLIATLVFLNSCMMMKKEKPIDVPAQMEHGKELEKNSDYRQAIIVWQKLHKHDPTNGYYLYHIGWNFSRLKEYPKAVTYLQESLSFDHENVDAMLALGYVYLWTDRFDLATKQFNDVLSKVPDYQSAEQGLEQVKERRSDSLQKEKTEAVRNQMERADHFEREDDLDQALLEWEKLNIEEPNNANYLYHIGRLYRILQQPLKAEKYLQDSLSIDPSNVDTQVVLGYVYYSLNKNEDAKRMFEDALESSPDYEDAKKGLESVNKRLQSNRISDALELETNKLTQKTQQHSDEKKRVEGAQTGIDSDRINSMGSVDAKKLVDQAHEYEVDKRYQDALVIWKEMSDRKPDNAYYLYKIGQMYSRLDQPIRSEEFLKKSIALAPQNSDALVALGYIYLNEEKFDQAKDAFNQALVISPDYKDAQDGLLSIDKRLVAIAEDKKKK